jgi:DNA helicase II / ATP-dependent DNA helicase PcrA
MSTVEIMNPPITLDTVFDGLDGPQRDAVTSDAQPLCIVAGAGSGKTTVLTRRIVRRSLDGSADLRHVLAITFTRKAANELQRRLASAGIRERATVGTFHAVAWSVLRQRATDQNRKPPTLLASRVSLVRELVAPRYDDASEITAEIDWARARRVGPAEYIAAARRDARTTRLSATTIAEQFEAYEGRKKGKRLVDFDDLLETVIRDIERDRQFADVMRWRFRHLFVDEFQDINPLQFKLLEAWRGDRADLCVVGDPSQSIYGWNGSDPTVLRNIGEYLPGVTVLRLDANHRSSPQIVQAGQRVLGNRAPTATAPRPDGPAPVIATFLDEHAEAKGIADVLDRYRDTRKRWSSCAVLVRTNSQLAPIDAALAASGIPTRRRTARTVFDHPAVRKALDDDGGTLRDWLAELQTRIAELGENERAVADPTTVEALRSVVERGYEFLQADPTAPVGAFRQAMTSPDEFGFDGVDLLSFHAAKGLEWDTVVIAGAENGLIPHSSAGKGDGVDEERRLFYVAVTRATRQLIATLAVERAGKARNESPFLDALRLPGAEPADSVANELKRIRERPRPPTNPLLFALREWRATTARAAAVPDHLVLADDLLQRIVDTQPDTLEALETLAGTLVARRFGGALLREINAVAEAELDKGPS